MAELLQLKGLISSLEDQVEGFKRVVTAICEANKGEFVDGILAVEGVGQVKIVANAPGLKLIATGKNLNAIEQAGLVTVLGPKFGKLSVDVVMVRDEIRKGNKKVVSALKKHKVELVQVDRYDVKEVKEVKKN